MVKIVDSFALENDFDIIIPICFKLDYKKGLSVHSYEITKSIADDFVGLYSGDPFACEAIDYLCGSVEPIIKKYNYHIDENKKYGWIYNFYIDEINMLNVSLIQPETQKFNKNIKLNNLTDINTDIIIKQKLKMFVTVINGNIVSFAHENSYYGEQDYIEIGTGTAQDYRDNGYAASNVAALTRYILKKNKIVTYNCDKNNIRSRRVAEKAGFINDGKSYHLICYKN